LEGRIAKKTFRGPQKKEAAFDQTPDTSSPLTKRTKRGE